MSIACKATPFKRKDRYRGFSSACYWNGHKNLTLIYTNYPKLFPPTLGGMLKLVSVMLRAFCYLVLGAGCGE